MKLRELLKLKGLTSCCFVIKAKCECCGSYAQIWNGLLRNTNTSSLGKFLDYEIEDLESECAGMVCVKIKEGGAK